MEKRKIRFQTIMNIILILLALYVLYTQFAQQTPKQYPVRLRFYGEYSQADGPWTPLENTDLSSMDGDLILRGDFGMQIPENSTISFYAFHLRVSFEINGKLLINTLPQECGYAQWLSVRTPRIAEGDEVRIRLSNPHGLGNAQAYKGFLESFYLGDRELVEDAVEESTLSRRIAGITVIAFSLALLAIALVFVVLRLSTGNKLWPIGIMALCYGGYLCLVSPSAGLDPAWATVNTCALYVCVITATFVLEIMLKDYLGGLRKSIASCIILMQSIGMLVLCISFVVGRFGLCTGLGLWLLLQISSTVVMLMISVWQWIVQEEKKIGTLGCCVVLLGIIVLETLNEYLMLWPERLLIDLAAALFFFSYAVHGAVSVPLNFRTAEQAEKLASDLNQSRIILAMSQIRAHFIFNVLNAISGMCKYDPQKADETVIRFARYLRGNIDVMQMDQNETFSATLRHLEDYIALEQIRFGDLLRFETDIEAENFKLPPLVLQPIVENAIKHGINPKPDGGTISLRTRQELHDVVITIEDDGVGFDVSDLEKKDSVGLSNVRFRLNQMVQGSSMQILSTKGHGTTVIITIPNQEV